MNDISAPIKGTPGSPRPSRCARTQRDLGSRQKVTFRHLGLGLLVSRTLRKKRPLPASHPVCGFCDSSPSRRRQDPARRWADQASRTEGPGQCSRLLQSRTPGSRH